jgi:hypothetical protein
LATPEKVDVNVSTKGERVETATSVTEFAKERVHVTTSFCKPETKTGETEMDSSELDPQIENARMHESPLHCYDAAPCWETFQMSTEEESPAKLPPSDFNPWDMLPPGDVMPDIPPGENFLGDLLPSSRSTTPRFTPNKLAFLEDLTSSHRPQRLDSEDEAHLDRHDSQPHHLDWNVTHAESSPEKFVPTHYHNGEKLTFLQDLTSHPGVGTFEASDHTHHLPSVPESTNTPVTPGPSATNKLGFLQDLTTAPSPIPEELPGPFIDGANTSAFTPLSRDIVWPSYIRMWDCNGTDRSETSHTTDVSFTPPDQLSIGQPSHPPQPPQPLRISPHAGGPAEEGAHEEDWEGGGDFSDMTETFDDEDDEAEVDGIGS